MAYSSKTPINDIPLQTFIEQLSVLRAEDWQKRVNALRTLVNSIPDYSTTLLNEQGELLLTNNGLTNDNGGEVMWYRSPKMVRRLATPLKSLLLDARSAVVKEVTELIGILLRVKLQSHPSITMAKTSSKNGSNEVDNSITSLQTINGSSTVSSPPTPPPFIGRLLFKDLLPSILDLSKQTVKVIRNYGVSMTLSIIPYIRIKSTINLLLEKMKLNPSRTVREDCAKYLCCILSSWPWDSTGSYDNISSNYTPPEGIVIVKNSRKDERLSLDSTRQIGLALGRTLSDPSKPVRDEVKKGFEVLYKRFRPIWDEVMSSGVVRDVRLRKKLLEVASRDVATSTTGGGEGKGEGGSSTHLFDDMASLGEMSLNSAVSGLSYASHRSNMSHRSYASNRGERRIPSVIGTPGKVRSRRSPSNGGSSPSYMRNTGSSASRVSEQVGKIQAKESSYRYATNEYVTASGHKLSTPSPKRYSKPSSLYYRGEDGRDEGGEATEQPFASLMHTPTRPTRNHMTPESQQKTCKVLRKRLSCRISGINGSVAAFEKELPDHIQSPSGLQSINELSLAPSAPPTKSPVVEEDTTQPEAEITTVALEVISAHLSHIDQMESLVSKERELLSDLSTKLGVSITNEMNAAELSEHIAKSLSEEQVCDYYESVHVCVDKQRTVSEELLGEMERISTGDTSTIVSGIDSPASLHKDLPQSPKDDHQESLQRNLKDEF